MQRLQVSNILEIYKAGKPITCLSLYDCCMSSLADELDIPLILVGDSLGMTVLGYKDTVNVTLEDCIRHSSAVVRGTKRAFVVGDLPFLRYHGSLDKTLEYTRLLIQKSGVSAVKLEGGKEIIPAVKALVQAGVSVMGHLGILPQRVRITEGYHVEGREKEEKEQLLKDALSLEEAGIFSLVLEGITSELAKEITDILNIPTIGIGAGIHCDGQIQVVNDILGLSEKTPKHAKKYAHLSKNIKDAFQLYKKEVEEKQFPSNKESFF